MQPPKQLYIVRHGQTDYNLKRIVQGRGVDAALNDTGIAQAKALFRHYQHHRFDAIYASALQRTYQTVSPFLQQGYEINRFAQLDEIDWGVHEGRVPNEEERRIYKQVIDSWNAGILHAKTENGESPLQVQERLNDFLHNHLYHQKQHHHQKTLICTHGRTSRILICTLLNQSLQQMDHYQHKNTSVAKLEWNEKANSYQLLFFGNIDHLS